MSENYLTECRYNKYHKVKRTKLVFHEFKCPDKNSSIGTCIFNPNHKFPIAEMETHKLNCNNRPDRPIIRQENLNINKDSETREPENKFLNKNKDNKLDVNFNFESEYLKFKNANNKDFEIETEVKSLLKKNVKNADLGIESESKFLDRKMAENVDLDIKTDVKYLDKKRISDVDLDFNQNDRNYIISYENSSKNKTKEIQIQNHENDQIRFNKIIDKSHMLLSDELQNRTDINYQKQSLNDSHNNKYIFWQQNEKDNYKSEKDHKISKNNFLDDNKKVKDYEKEAMIRICNNLMEELNDDYQGESFNQIF